MTFSIKSHALWYYAKSPVYILSRGIAFWRDEEHDVKNMQVSPPWPPGLALALESVAPFFPAEDEVFTILNGGKIQNNVLLDNFLQNLFFLDVFSFCVFFSRVVFIYLRETVSCRKIQEEEWPRLEIGILSCLERHVCHGILISINYLFKNYIILHCRAWNFIITGAFRSQFLYRTRN